MLKSLYDQASFRNLNGNDDNVEIMMMTQIYFSGSPRLGKTTITMNIPTLLPIATATDIVTVMTLMIVMEEDMMTMEGLTEEVIMAAMVEVTRSSPRSRDLTDIRRPTSNVRRQVRRCM